MRNIPGLGGKLPRFSKVLRTSEKAPELGTDMVRQVDRSPREEVPPMSLPVAPTDNRFRILVLDDEDESSNHVVALLDKAGFACRRGTDPIFVGWTQINPHLVILRKSTSLYDGFQVCTDIREGRAGAGTTIPVIILGPADETSEVLAFKAGADDYLSEPLRPNSLMARLVATLRRAYRYNEPPKVAARSGPPVNLWDEDEDGAPLGAVVSSGFAECRLCGYSGSRQQFESEDMMGRLRAACPSCRSTEHIVFSLD